MSNEGDFANRWDEAIYDAEQKLREAEDKVRQLLDAIRIFRRRRDAGEPFFGEKSKKTAG